MHSHNGPLTHFLDLLPDPSQLDLPKSHHYHHHNPRYQGSRHYRGHTDRLSNNHQIAQSNHRFHHCHHQGHLNH